MPLLASAVCDGLFAATILLVVGLAVAAILISKKI
jgi:hypothetical protein